MEKNQGAIHQYGDLGMDQTDPTWDIRLSPAYTQSNILPLKTPVAKRLIGCVRPVSVTRMTCALWNLDLAVRGLDLVVRGLDLAYLANGV